MDPSVLDQSSQEIRSWNLQLDFDEKDRDMSKRFQINLPKGTIDQIDIIHQDVGAALQHSISMRIWFNDDNIDNTALFNIISEMLPENIAGSPVSRRTKNKGKMMKIEISLPKLEAGKEIMPGLLEIIKNISQHLSINLPMDAERAFLDLGDFSYLTETTKNEYDETTHEEIYYTRG